jgi:tetratricopeptide (TPR) repeat protein
VAEAIALLRHALEADPDSLAARIQLAAALQQSGQWEAALAVWQAALTRAPRNAPAREQLGALLAAADRTEDELACWQAGLALEPGHEQWQMRVAELLQANHTEAELLAFMRRYAADPACARMLAFLLRAQRATPAVALWVDAHAAAAAGSAVSQAEQPARLAARLASEFYRGGQPQTAVDFAVGVLNACPGDQELAAALSDFWLLILADPHTVHGERAEDHLRDVRDAAVVQKITAAANEDDPVVSRRARRVLYHSDPEKVWRLLGRQLEDAPPAGKAAAAELLVVLYGPRGVRLLEARLGVEKDNAVQGMLTATLRRFDPRPRTLLDKASGRRRWAADHA